MSAWPKDAGLDYCDAGGDTSRRVVTVSAIKRHHDVLMLSGYCQLRKAFRNFRSDRIQDLFDPATGEMFDDVVEALETHPKFDDEDDWQPVKPADLPLDIEAMLKSLGYLASLTHAKADEKVAIMRAFLDSVWHCLPAQEQTLDVYLHGLDPHYAEIGRGFTAAAADLACRKPFLDACWVMAQLDGRITDREANFLRRVQIAFRKMGIDAIFDTPLAKPTSPRTSSSPPDQSAATLPRQDTPWMAVAILITIFFAALIMVALHWH